MEERDRHGRAGEGGWDAGEDNVEEQGLRWSTSLTSVRAGKH